MKKKERIAELEKELDDVNKHNERLKTQLGLINAINSRLSEAVILEEDKNEILSNKIKTLEKDREEYRRIVADITDKLNNPDK